MYKALKAELFYWDGSLKGAQALMEWVDYPVPDTMDAPDYIRLQTDKLNTLIPPHSWVVKLGDEVMPCNFEVPMEVFIGQG